MALCTGRLYKGSWQYAQEGYRTDSWEYVQIV